MSPRAVVAAAVERGLDMIAICDHNSAENVAAVQEASRRQPVHVLAGIEVTSREEVHVLGLFGEMEQALSMQDLIYAHLDGENDAARFGLQVVADSDDEVRDFNPRLLIGATDLPLEAVVAAVHSRAGLAVAAHVDREGFGLVGQLGFIPEDLPLDALEISPRLTLQEARKRFADEQMYPFIQGSDAHRLEQIGGGFTVLRAEAANWEELCLALRSAEGRGIRTGC
jgi:hypothetical protein